MKRIVILFCLSFGLFLNVQAKLQETFSDTTITPYTSPTEKTGRRFGRSWMQQQKERRINRQPQKAYMLPGAEISAETETAYAVNKYHETPEKGWTPLHQKIYDELLSGDVAAALQSVRKLKQKGGSVDVPIPHDIRRRTLHAAAFDIDEKFFNNDLELSPDWASLIEELQSDRRITKR